MRGVRTATFCLVLSLQGFGAVGADAPGKIQDGNLVSKVDSVLALTSGDPLTGYRVPYEEVKKRLLALGEDAIPVLVRRIEGPPMRFDWIKLLSEFKHPAAEKKILGWLRARRAVPTGERHVKRSSNSRFQNWILQTNFIVKAAGGFPKSKEMREELVNFLSEDWPDSLDKLPFVPSYRLREELCNTLGTFRATDDVVKALEGVAKSKQDRASVAAMKALHRANEKGQYDKMFLEMLADAPPRYAISILIFLRSVDARSTEKQLSSFIRLRQSDRRYERAVNLAKSLLKRAEPERSQPRDSGRENDERREKR